MREICSKLTIKTLETRQHSVEILWKRTVSAYFLANRPTSAGTTPFQNMSTPVKHRPGGFIFNLEQFSLMFLWCFND